VKSASGYSKLLELLSIGGVNMIFFLAYSIEKIVIPFRSSH